jgi:hypothetical protein
LYCDGSLKWLVILIGMVSAEMLNCKLLLARAAGMKDVYFTLCDVNHQWPDMANSSTRTLCYGEEQNVMVR